MTHSNPRDPRKIALTISPEQRVEVKANGLNLEEVRQRYLKDCYCLHTALNRCSNNYTIYPEFDDKGRLHYHGIVFVHSLIAMKLETNPVLQDKLGFICIKYDPDEKWDQYCEKEWEITKEILDITDPIRHIDLRKLKRPVIRKPPVNANECKILIQLNKSIKTVKRTPPLSNAEKWELENGRPFSEFN